jgi:hypothetical protein
VARGGRPVNRSVAKWGRTWAWRLRSLCFSSGRRC